MRSILLTLQEAVTGDADFAAVDSPENGEQVEVYNMIAERTLRFTVDGSDPGVEGANCYIIFGVGSLNVRVSGKPLVRGYTGDAGGVQAQVTLLRDRDLPGGT